MQPEQEIQLPIFVYGTLRPGAKNYGIVREFVMENGIRPATLQGFIMFDFVYFPGIVEATLYTHLEPVTGDILYIKQDRYDEALICLDRFESNGYLFNRTDKFFADTWPREEDGLWWSDRKKTQVRVWTYIANTSLLVADFELVVKSNDWMNRGG